MLTSKIRGEKIRGVHQLWAASQQVVVGPWAFLWKLRCGSLRPLASSGNHWPTRAERAYV